MESGCSDTPVSEVNQIVHVLPTFTFMCMLSGW